VKVTAVADWAKSLEDEGYNVAIFATYLSTLDQIREVLADPTNGVNPIDIRGGQTPEQRESERKRFQSNAEHYALVEIAAGSISLDLDDQIGEGGRPRVALIFPTWSAQQFVQATGRINRAGSKSPAVQYMVYAAGVEAEQVVRRKLDEKLGNLEALNDGDFRPETAADASADVEPTTAEILAEPMVIPETPETVPAAPSGDPAPKIAKISDGFYYKGGNVYKVQIAAYGSGRLYAKKLVVEPGERARFVYEPGAVSTLVPGDKMTFEQAVAFGKLYGVCARCGRLLTDEDSIEAGMGPVCRGYF
jgi:hypothetical protein